jgi:NAD(P)-dependent dehydrogenase (short-subunit alcohol dehydrogenase family)
MGHATRVVVTGAAGGAGSAAVEVFAEDGADVAAIVHSARLDDRVSAAANVTEYVCDVSDRDAVHATFDRIATDLGGIDALVHTAAIESYAPASDIESDQLARMLMVNVGGTVFTNQAAHRHMRAGGGGSIINFHSLTAIRGFGLLAHYAASKGAVGAWTRVAAVEWGADNVRVNAIAPVMLTSMSKNYRATLSPEELEGFMESMRQVIHLKDGEYGDPKQDIAPVLRFLASDDARYITGQTIAVDGGWVKLGS